MTAMVIATGLNGANIPKERRINNDTLFFFFAQKTANEQNGVKNAFIYCVFRAKRTIFDFFCLPLQSQTALPFVWIGRTHIY